MPHARLLLKRGGARLRGKSNAPGALAVKHGSLHLTKAEHREAVNGVWRDSKSAHAAVARLKKR